MALAMPARDLSRVCYKTKSGTIWTPKGRLSYAFHLFEPGPPPGGDNDPKKLRYSTSLILPGNVDISLLRTEIAATAKAKWGDKATGLKDPILDHVAKNTKQPDLARQFPILLRFTSQYKPSILYPNGEEVKEPQQAYSGRWAKISINLWTWNHPLSGKGVSLGLQSVILMDDDDRLGGVGASKEDDWQELMGADSSMQEFTTRDAFNESDEGESDLMS
jgi:ssDNA-binding protein